MKTILATIAIVLATITTANAQDKEAHCFKAALLEKKYEALAPHKPSVTELSPEQISRRLAYASKLLEENSPDKVAEIISNQVSRKAGLRALLGVQAYAHRRACNLDN